MLHRFAVLTAVLTLPLVFAGATVTTKDAALSVPDWPLSYGSPFPRMVGNIVYEHGHRLLAALVGLFTLILAVWTQRAEPRRGVRVLAWTALFAVVLQGTLGGLTVLQLRPPAVSAIHACLAQAFFALVASLALVTSPGWAESGGLAGGAVPAARAAAPRFLPLATAALIYLQIAVGATVRHLRAALSIPDFPLSFGGLWPPSGKLADPGVAAQFAHRLLGVAVLLLVTVTALRAISTGLPALRAPAVLCLVLGPLQVLLGAATVWSGRDHLAATTHVALGGLLWVTSVVLALRSWRAATRPRVASSGEQGYAGGFALGAAGARWAP